MNLFVLNGTELQTATEEDPMSTDTCMAKDSFRSLENACYH